MAGSVCYFFSESNRNILKINSLDQAKSQIINIESGAFGKVPQSDIDIEFDNTTVNPGNYKFEKMFAGGYFGGLCLTALKTAAKEGVFVEPASAASIAGLLKLTNKGYFPGKSKIVCILTGHGLKDPDRAIKSVKAPKLLKPELKTILKTIGY